jgi:hypothetical protein
MRPGPLDIYVRIDSIVIRRFQNGSGSAVVASNVADVKDAGDDYADDEQWLQNDH